MDRLRVVTSHLPGAPPPRAAPAAGAAEFDATSAVEVRPITLPADKAELQALVDYVGAGSWGTGGTDSLADAAGAGRQYTIGAYAGGRLVSSFAAWPFTIRANGGSVKMAGVTSVGSRPEFRRRGIVRKIMTRAFAEYRAAGIPTAGLWATQGAIYQRYGFAYGCVRRQYTVDTVDIAFADGDGGSQRVACAVDADAALGELRATHRAFLEDRTLYIHRSKEMWKNTLDRKSDRVATNVAFSRDASGAARGYVVFHIESNSGGHSPPRSAPSRPQTIVVRDLAWLDMDAYRSLWSFLARHDTVGEVKWDSAPGDDPAMQLWLEPANLRQRDGLGHMFRVVDLAPALERRHYTTPGTVHLVVEEDRLAPWNEGCWRLDAGTTGGKVARRPSPDGAPNTLTVSTKALGLLYLGHHSARQLAAWGMVKGDAGALAAADTVFAVKHAPHCLEVF